MNLGSGTIRFVSLISIFFSLCHSAAGQIPVRYTEGLVHGFLVLRTMENEILAHGDLVQVAHGSHVTVNEVFHFKDGSLRDETVVYSQLRSFQLLQYHLVQKGPAFPHPEDISIDVPSGRVEVRDASDGKESIKTERMKLPGDLANGLLFTLLKNMSSPSQEAKASMLVTIPKPRLVKLAISSQGEDTFLVGGERRKAIHYQVKIQIAGVAGLVAPLLGKQPPDIQVWIFPGKAPAFIKSIGPLYSGGPAWQIEVESPVWPPQEEK